MEPTSDPARPPQAPANLEALLGGRGLQIAGLLSLFGSGAFFFKLAVDHGWLDPLVRVLIGAAAGAAFLIAGVAQKRDTIGTQAVSEGLIALGAALLFLTAWAAGPLFGLVPNLVALTAMGVVTAVLTLLALRMQSPLTAIYGLVGGLLAPALAPCDDRVVLAGYLLALCGAMLYVAERGRFRSNVLAPLALAGTLLYSPHFAVDAARGWTYLDVLAVLMSFFVTFACAGIVSVRRGTATRLDLAVAAANVGIFVGFAWADLANHHLVLTAALAAAAVFLAGVARSLAPSKTRIALWWIACGIATLAVLPAVDLRGETAAAIWVLEGAGFYVFGARRADEPVRAAALALLALAAPFALADLAQTTAPLPFFNGDFLKALAVVAALVTVALESHAFAFRRTDEPQIENVLPFVASVGASLIALAAIIEETVRLPRVPLLEHLLGSGAWPVAAVSIVATIYAVGLFVAGHVRQSGNLRSQSLVLFGLVLAKVVVFDLATVELVYRVATLFGLGVATLAISAVYLRRGQVQRFFTRPAD